jgi:hypothetical protein
MRRIFLLSAMLVLSAAWTLAQHEYDSTPNSNVASRTAAYRTTVEGCLDIQSGNYILTLPSGSVFHLSGGKAQLTSHVGENVRITGVVTPVVNVPGATAEATETQPTLSVGSLMRVSGVCKTNNDVR